MTVAPQADTSPQLIAGTITGIVQKGTDKWQVVVQPDGSQYTKNLWTKDAGLVGQLSMMIGSHQAFVCGPSHWTNAQGQPVTSWWINGVGPEAAQQMQLEQQQVPVQPSQWPQAPQPMPLPQQPTVVQPQVARMGVTAQPSGQSLPAPPSPYEKDQRIMREAATKVAAILISHVPVEQRTIDNVLRLSEQLVGYYEYGLNSRPDPNLGDDGGPGHTDDDIPF